MEKIITEYVGYGLFDSRIDGIDIRGIGRNEYESVQNLFDNIQESYEFANLKNGDYKLAI